MAVLDNIKAVFDLIAAEFKKTARIEPTDAAGNYVLHHDGAGNVTPVPESGGGGGGTTQVFVQSTQPADTGSPYIWIQTGLPNGGTSIWFNDDGTT